MAAAETQYNEIVEKIKNEQVLTEDETSLYNKYNDNQAWMDAGRYYKSYRFELGAQLKADFKVDVNDNFTFSSQVVAFYNYLKPKQAPRVAWDNRIFWKLAKYFSLTLSTNLLYDPEVNIPLTLATQSRRDKELKKDATATTFKGVQFKEFLELGFTYTIASKK